MFNTVEKLGYVIAIMLALFVLFFGYRALTKQRPQNQVSISISESDDIDQLLDIVKSGDNVNRRIEAIRRIGAICEPSRSDSSMVTRRLVDQLPGRFDVVTREIVQVLIYVGDCQALPVLSDIVNTPDVAKQIRVAAEYAIEEISSRHDCNSESRDELRDNGVRYEWHCRVVVAARCSACAIRGGVRFAVSS